jgi:hypothetical protein
VRLFNNLQTPIFGGFLEQPIFASLYWLVRFALQTSCPIIRYRMHPHCAQKHGQWD